MASRPVRTIAPPASWLPRSSGRRRPAERVALSMALVTLLLLPTALGLVRSIFERPPPVVFLGWRGIVPQTLPNTCGPAVLATLLLSIGLRLSDAAVAERASLTTAGITLAEFSRLASGLGLAGRWSRATPRGLGHLDLPTVVHLADSSGHFAVLREDLGHVVLLADPARGNLLASRSSFVQDWSGRVFQVERARER
jgi:hypothetical protein